MSWAISWGCASRRFAKTDGDRLLWTDAAWRAYVRRRPRPASDLRDREWALMAPLLPSAASGRPPPDDGPDDGPGGGDERDALHRDDRPPAAHAPEGPSARLEGAALFPRMARQRLVADDRRSPGPGGARAAGGASPSAGLIARADSAPAEPGRPLYIIVLSRYPDHQTIPSGWMSLWSERKNHRERRDLRLGRRQAGQGWQAAHRRRHLRPAGRARGSRGRHPGSRRSASGPGLPPRPLALAAPRLGGRRLWRAGTRGSPAPPRRLDDPDRQAVRSRQRLRGSANAPGRRTHLRRARTTPPTGEGPGEIPRSRRGAHLHRPYPPPDQAPRKALARPAEFGVRLREHRGG